MAKKNSMYPVLRIGKLDIRHDTPKSRDDLKWLQIYNVYWGEKFLGAKVPMGINIMLPRGYVYIVTQPTGSGHYRRAGFHFHAFAAPKDYPISWAARYFPFRRLFKAIRWYRRWQAALAKD